MTELGASALLAGRYDLGPVIGTGGMARVHRATDTLLGRTVAVKVFRVDADPSHAARIRDEARTLAAVQHPGLVAVFDAGTWDRDDGSEVPYLVMELVGGGTLAECCLDGSLGPDDVARIGAELADALAHVHHRGIVHRDVKPANILLDAARRPKLTDFGIARLVDSARHTQTGLTVGTAAYLSPEQVRGQEVGPPSDVYSLALVLLEALTGRREYAGNSVETALARLERPAQVPDDLPPQLRSVLERMTVTDAEDRPTAASVAAELRGDPAPVATTRLLTTAAPASEPSASHSPTAMLTGTAPPPGAAPEPARVARPQVQRGRPSSSGVLGEIARDATRNPVVLGGLLLLLLVVAVVVALLAGGGDDGTATEPPPAKAPTSQLEQDLADLREAVTP